MTAEEFELSWAENTKMTIDQLHAEGLRAVLCDCEIEGCWGWKLEHESITNG